MPRRAVPVDALRIDAEVVHAGAMSYIIQRQHRYYVVAYDGLDPVSGKRTPPMAPRRPRPH